MEPFGVMENAIETGHVQQIGLIYLSGTGVSAKVYPDFWTNGLALLQLAAHPGLQRITCAGVCSCMESLSLSRLTG